MAVGISTEIFRENPYLTLAEYQNAPTSIDYNNLVVGGNQDAQDAELERVIMRASSYMNEYFNQSLVATVITETQRTRFTPQGFIALHPNNSPIVALESFYYGSDPNNLNVLNDPSKAWFESQQIIIPLSTLSATYSSQGPLSFGAIGPSGTQIFTKYTYVSGFVNTTTVTAVAAASSLTVLSAAGIVPNLVLNIYDGSKAEKVTVSSAYVYGSTTVPLTSALVYTHESGAAIGNLPASLKQACVLLTTAFIKMRGDGSMTMAITTSATGNAGGETRYSSEIKIALDMIDQYRRIR